MRTCTSPDRTCHRTVILGQRPYAVDVLTVGVCEDDPTVRGVIVDTLRREGHEVVAAHNGREAVTLFADRDDLDVLVLDIGLPDSDGRDVCQALRSAGQHAPVLFLTALDALHDRLSGFHAGGDDYVAKPFAGAELIVRVAALARRGRESARAVGGLTLDPQRFALVTATGEVRLTPTEFRMIAALSGRPGEVVRRRKIVAAAWPDGAIVSENTVDSYIRRIRTKLASVGSPATIETVRGVGYVLR
jgi:two-component system OmpR family response regulator